jgi:hypothetical protein
LIDRDKIGQSAGPRYIQIRPLRRLPGLTISLKYAILIMRADNRGEGGIMALLALPGARRATSGNGRASLLVVG